MPSKCWHTSIKQIAILTIYNFTSQNYTYLKYLYDSIEVLTII